MYIQITDQSKTCHIPGLWHFEQGILNLLGNKEYLKKQHCKDTHHMKAHEVRRPISYLSKGLSVLSSRTLTALCFSEPPPLSKTLEMILTGTCEYGFQINQINPGKQWACRYHNLITLISPLYLNTLEGFNEMISKQQIIIKKKLVSLLDTSHVFREVNVFCLSFGRQGSYFLLAMLSLNLKKYLNNHNYYVNNFL